MKDADFPLSASLHGNVCSSPLIKRNSGGVGGNAFLALVQMKESMKIKQKSLHYNPLQYNQLEI